MTVPNPPKLPKALEEAISTLERKFLFEEMDSRADGAIHSSCQNGKETHIIDFYGYMKKGKFARVSFTIIIADKMEKLSLGN